MTLVLTIGQNSTLDKIKSRLLKANGFNRITVVSYGVNDNDIIEYLQKTYIHWGWSAITFHYRKKPYFVFKLKKVVPKTVYFDYVQHWTDNSKCLVL